MFGETGVEFGLISKQPLYEEQKNEKLLWIEHKVHIRLEIEFSINQKLPNLLKEPLEWEFSSDYGKTTLKTFDNFAQKLNNKLLKIQFGHEHVYIPDEPPSGIQLLFDSGDWYPIHSMKIFYRFRRLGWLGIIPVSKEITDFDHKNYSEKTSFTFNFPIHRDPSWEKVWDPDFSKLIYEMIGLPLFGFEIANISTNDFYFEEIHLRTV